MRTLLVALALTLAPAALACGGNDCGSSCPMKAAAEAATDAPELADDVEGTQVTLAVSGVHCPMSAAQAQAALLTIEGVNAAAVTPSGEARVAYDESKTDQDGLVAAINALEGYGATVPAATGG
jgi:copper chaperone CopZ